MTPEQKRIKIAAIAIIVPLISFANPGEIKLAWSPSTDAEATSYTHTLYAHTNAFATNFTYTAQANAGTNLTATVSDLAPGRWYFAVTARDTNGVESKLSNVLPYQTPSPPSDLRTVILQYSASVTNFQDMIFFKLRFP
jgi:hypothetical protein